MDGVDLCLDLVAPAIQLHVATLRAILLDVVSRCSLGLITHKQNIGSGVANQRLEIIDNATATAHATRGNHYAGTRSPCEVLNRGNVILVSIDGSELFKCQGMASLVQVLPGLPVPEGLACDTPR